MSERNPGSGKGLYVLDGEEKIPFLRGIMTHSLMERGLSFEQAYETASLVRDRIRQQQVITREELARLVKALVRQRFGLDLPEGPPRKAPLQFVIRVRDGDSDSPFSKGILSQSLQASGLDPSIAYDIAREIESFLIQNNRREVGRGELRRLIYDTIRHNYDPKFAERYLLWRCLKSPDRPVIILFGGATGTGKTSVASEVGHRLGIQKVLATDTIRQIMRMMFSRDLLPAIHVSSYEAWKERFSLTADPRGAVVEAFQEQSQRVLVGVRAMIERAIQENFSLVVEGVHLVPGLIGVEHFKDRAYLARVVLAVRDRERHLRRFPRREEEAGSRVADKYRENFAAIAQIQDFILEMAEHNGVPVIDNNSYDETVSMAMEVITQSLREQLKINSEELISKAL